MKKSVKEQWLKDLRSGEYQQTTDMLKSCEGMCCLGVLADQYLKEEGQEWSDEGTHFELPDGEAGELSTDIEEWAELDSTDPRIGDHYASHWNDAKGKSFPEIADLIEEFL